MTNKEVTMTYDEAIKAMEESIKILRKEKFQVVKKSKTTHCHYVPARYRNVFFEEDKKITVTRRQINFGVTIRLFRYSNEFSLKDVVTLCNLEGKETGIKFSETDISNYENFKTVPSPAKFNVILKVLRITEDDIK